jgi:hypothetical protein
VAYRICLAVAYSCTPRVRRHWYRATRGVQPVRHGYLTYQWRTDLYATATAHSRGVQLCTPRVCFVAVAYKRVRLGCIWQQWRTELYASDMYATEPLFLYATAVFFRIFFYSDLLVYSR